MNLNRLLKNDENVLQDRLRKGSKITFYISLAIILMLFVVDAYAIFGLSIDSFEGISWYAYFMTLIGSQILLTIPILFITGSFESQYIFSDERILFTLGYFGTVIAIPYSDIHRSYVFEQKVSSKATNAMFVFEMSDNKRYGILDFGDYPNGLKRAKQILQKANVKTLDIAKHQIDETRNTVKENKGELISKYKISGAPLWQKGLYALPIVFLALGIIDLILELI